MVADNVVKLNYRRRKRKLPVTHPTSASDVTPPAKMAASCARSVSSFLGKCGKCNTSLSTVVSEVGLQVNYISLLSENKYVNRFKLKISV